MLNKKCLIECFDWGPNDRSVRALVLACRLMWYLAVGLRRICWQKYAFGQMPMRKWVLDTQMNRSIISCVRNLQ